MKAETKFYFGVFLVSASTLMLELILTRILSVVTWYYLAFLVISLAMFGMTAGAVWIHLQGDRFRAGHLTNGLSNFAQAFAATTAVSLGLMMSLALGMAPSVTSLVVWYVLVILIATPFFFSGVVLTLALTRSQYPAGKVYGFDLIGGAIGCLIAIILLDHTDAPSAVLWVAALAAAGAAFLVCPAENPESLPSSLLPDNSKRPVLLAVVLAVCAMLNGMSDMGLKPLVIKGKIEESDGTKSYERWNSHSRVAVYEEKSKSPVMWGVAKNFFEREWEINQYYLNIDGDAGTVMYENNGDLEHLEFLKHDITNLAYHLKGRKDAAVIGVGGGRDILSAKVFGIENVFGIEVNPVFIDLLTDHAFFSDFAGMDKLSGVEFIYDDGRSWLARTTRRFDIIQMSMIDTWAATGAGAFSLSENGLYTREAWKTFLSRLSPEGVLTVSRWHSPNFILESGRIASLAVSSLYGLGVTDPSRHIIIASAGNIATLIVAREPFAQADLAVLEKVIVVNGFHHLAGPGRIAVHPELNEIISAKSESDLLRITSSISTGIDLTPPSDERPFFFNQLPLSRPGHLLQLATKYLKDAEARGVIQGNLVATATLTFLFLVSFLLVLVTVIVPLKPVINDVGRTLAVGGTLYFLLLGIGFMAVEIALLQRMSIFLGHPIYSLGIVLFTLILCTGGGSLVSHHYPLKTIARFIVWSIATGAYILLLAFSLPWILAGFESYGLLPKALLSIAILTPVGLLLGFGMPTGLWLVSCVSSKPSPWFWGINGAAGVLASIMAIGCSIAFGITFTLFLGAGCYFLLVPAAISIGFRNSEGTTENVQMIKDISS